MNLSAVYVLDSRKSRSSACLIETMAPSPAMMALVTNTYVNYLLDSDMRRHDFDVLGRVVASVPIRSVNPPDDPSRLREICRTIAANAKGLLTITSASAVPGRY